MQDAENWLKNIRKSLEYINKTLPQNLEAVAVPAANLHPKYLQTRNAQEFGCEPDFNVWTRSINNRPSATDSTLRSAGFHIHIGYKNKSEEIDEYLVKALDLFLSVPATIVEPDNQRKQLYGKAGAFRFKDYGVEYRSLSNYFINSDSLMKWVFDNTQTAIDFLNQRGIDEIEIMGKEIQEAVNNNNKVLANQIIRQFNIPLP